MNTQKITTLEELKEVAKDKFQLLQPNKNTKEGFIFQLPFDNYSELHYLIIDIVKVALLAIRAAEEDISEVKSPLSSIHGVLELLKHMIPLEEIQLLDTLHNIVVNQEDKPDINTDEK